VTFLQAFSAAHHWCDHSTRSFLLNEAFATSLVQLMNGEGGPGLSLKVIKIVKKLLNKSKYAKLLSYVSSLEEAHKMPEKELRFLHLIVAWLRDNQGAFVQKASLSLAQQEED
jgi:hypothetical protein